MLPAEDVEAEIEDYRKRLQELLVLFGRGHRSNLARLAQQDGDALVCLMEEAPLHQREAIDYLIDRFESLRISCMS